MDVVRHGLKEFETYLKVEKRYSEHTMAAYRNDLNEFARFTREYLGKAVESDLSLTEIDHLTIRGFLNHLHRRGFSKVSMARKLAAVRSFFRFLCRQGYIDKNPASTVNSPRLPKRLVQILQPEEMEQLLDGSFGQSVVEKRDCAIFELLYATGLRVGELTRLKPGDLEMDQRTLRVVGKGNKERLVLFGVKASEALTEYFSVRSQLLRGLDPGDLFLNQHGKRLSETRVRQILNTYLNKLALQKRVSPHSFRHSFASHLLNSGADLRFIQEILGHSSLSTTQKYTHLNVEQLLKTYNHAHPGGRKSKPHDPGSPQSRTLPDSDEPEKPGSN